MHTREERTDFSLITIEYRQPTTSIGRLHTSVYGGMIMRIFYYTFPISFSRARENMRYGSKSTASNLNQRDKRLRKLLSSDPK